MEDYEEDNGIIYKIEYVFMYWDMNWDEKEQDGKTDKLFKRKLEFKIHPQLKNRALQEWRQSIVIDRMNSEFYFQDYFSMKVQQYNRMHIQSQGIDSFEPFNIHKEVVQAITGQHNQFIVNEYKENKGLLYDDFLIFDNQLYIVHNRYVTIVDIQNERSRRVTTMSFNDYIVKDQKPVGGMKDHNYEFQDDVVSLFLMDKEYKDSTDRWRIIIIFNNGHVLELKKMRQDKRNFTHSKFNLHPFLKEDFKKEALLPGKVLKVYKNSNSITIPTYLLIKENSTDKILLCTIEYHSQKLKTWNLFDHLNFKDYQPQIVMLDSVVNDYQELVVFDNQNQKDDDAIEQNRIRAKINIKQFDGNLKEIYYPPEQLPTDLDNIGQTLSTFTCDNFVYLIMPNSINKYDVDKNICWKQRINDNFSSFQIFNNEFFYWRVYNKNTKIPSFKSSIQFDRVENILDFKQKSNNKKLSLFECQYPHLSQIYYDRMGESLSAFVDFDTIKVWPLLHLPYMKLKKSGKRINDVQILGSRLVHHLLYTLNSDNTIKIYHIRTGKLLEELPVEIHQSIDENHFMIKRKIDDPLDPLNRNSTTARRGNVNINNEQKKKYFEMFHYDEDLNSKIYQIDLRLNNEVKIVEYIVMEFIINNEDLQSKDSNVESAENHGIMMKQIRAKLIHHDIKVSESFRFLGPSWASNDNYGLYLSDDLQRAIFFYREHSYLRTNYYYFKQTHIIQEEIKEIDLNAEEGVSEINNQSNSKLVEMKESKIKFLKYHSKLNDGNLYSVHSSDFKHILKYSKKTGKISIRAVGPKNDMSTTKTSVFQEDKITSVHQQSILLPTEQEELEYANSRIQELSENTHGEPCFLGRDSILYMTEEKIVLACDFETRQELYYFANSYFPGCTNKTTLDTVIKTSNAILGENFFIYDIEHDRIVPNNFNHFLKKPAHYDDEDHYDPSEMKYIQLHEKTKIEFHDNCYSGYIFRAKEYLKKESYQTEIYIVNTFTYYNWRILDQDRIYIDEMTNKDLQELVFNQLPNGQTLLHKIYLDNNALQTLYQNINLHVQTKNDQEHLIYIPILADKNGKNFFDYILGDDFQQKLEQLGSNTKSAGDNVVFVLNQVGNYPYDLYKIKIDHLLDKLSRLDLVAFSQFLDDRCKRPSFVTQVSVARQKSNYIKQYTLDNIWLVPEEEINFKLSQGIINMIYKLNSVKQYILDIPNIHNSLNEKGEDNLNMIFDQIAKQSNYQPFESMSIKALIEVRWEPLLFRIIVIELIPYLCLLISFYVYTIYQCETVEKVVERDRHHMSRILRILIGTFLCYYCALKSLQVYKQKFFYVKNPWNYLDFGIIILIVAAEISHQRCLKYVVYETNTITDLEKVRQVDRDVRTIYSFVSLMMWIRVLYYFRIFRATGYYIRMLIQIGKDIQEFLLILLFTIIAFAHSYYVLTHNNSSGPTISSSWDALSKTYLIVFGQYDMIDAFPDYQIGISWLLYVLVTLAIQIVLLNLLISIISDIFGRFKENYNIIMYKDMLYLYIETRYLFLGRDNQKLRKNFFISQVDYVSAQDQVYEEHVKELKTMMREQAFVTKTKGKRMEKNFQRENKFVRERLDKIERMLTDIYKKVQQQ